ncbi:hypothetical protein Daus18300_011415 [Diaporthe australafricana]|uniref:C2H2-type domain-containing protein n=1 Tax=Diaporthe australafricana TaxID=127596 RepID=A0ABR3W6L2_9PEZI
METNTTFASYDMALDNIDPAEIEQLLRQMEWEQLTGQQIFAAPEYDTTNFEQSLSPLSGFASPSSMTTGSTNQSPTVPMLDYDMSYPMDPFMEGPESLFPELMDHSINMCPDWVGSAVEGYSGPVPTSNDAQLEAKTPSLYPMNSQPYPTASSDTTIYDNTPALSQYLTTEPPTVTAQTSNPTPSSSTTSPQQPTVAANTTSTTLTCPHCRATLTEKTKLKVHINKHTKPFRCAAEGCGYATAEKKSLQRHLVAKSKFDEEHRAAAQIEGVKGVRRGCARPGCTYTTVREDNLSRHMKTCTQ